MRTRPSVRESSVLAVDTQGGWMIDGRTGVWDECDLGDLHAYAKELGLSQIWICRSGLEVLGLPLEVPRGTTHPFLEHGSLVTPKGQDVLAPWLSVWERGGHFLEVTVPSWDRGSPFRDIDFGPELLGELLEFTEATGMLWKRSGAITSDAWLRDHFAKSGLLKATEYPDIARDGNLEPDLHTTRAPEGSELRANHLYAFDANAMYLGAMSSLALPVGSFIRYHALGCSVSEVGGPGYWRSGEGWMTSPTINFRAPVDIDEGYGWTESHRYLEPLYKTLRGARTTLLHRPDSAALEAVKQVYRQGVGRFGSTRRSVEDDVLYQPYWRHAVMAEARCRLLRRVDKLTAKPVAIDVDCLYFLTSVRSPAAFTAKIGLPLDDQIGHFKFAGEMSGKAAREILTGEIGRGIRGELPALRTGLTHG